VFSRNSGGYVERIQRFVRRQRNLDAAQSALHQLFPEAGLTAAGFSGVSPSRLGLIAMKGVQELADQVSEGKET
jgi:hypothetical protein